MTSSTAGKLVWITGASSGIGAGLAQTLATRGWRVAISARSEDALDAVAASAQARAIIPCPLDVTDRSAVADVWKAINETHGAPELVIINAGAWRNDSARNINAAGVAEMLSVNVMGCIHMMEVIAPAMMARGRGDIVVVASVAGYSGLPGAAGYCASKAALQAWCEAMQPELAAAGVNLMVANPGFVETPMTAGNDFPMPFIIPVQEAVDAILRGYERKKSSFSFPFVMGLMTRGLSILPTPLRLAIKRRMLRS